MKAVLGYEKLGVVGLFFYFLLLGQTIVYSCILFGFPPKFMQLQLLWIHNKTGPQQGKHQTPEAK